MVDPLPRDERIEQIRRGAVDVFAERGFRGTSMAAIAAAVGISRPAIYQYFDNREDVFRAAFELVLEESADAALAALTNAATLEDALAGYLQRGLGDGYESLSSLAHGAELLEAQHAFAADVAQRAFDRMRRGLASAVRQRSTAADATIAAALELLQLAPAGLKADRPTPATFRTRLDALAAAVAAMLAADA